jgi:hypothetical protein
MKVRSRLPPTYAYVTGEVKQYDYCPYGKLDYCPEIQPEEPQLIELSEDSHFLGCGTLAQSTSAACEITSTAGSIAREITNAAVRATMRSMGMFSRWSRLVMALIMVSGIALMVSSALLLDGMESMSNHHDERFLHMPHMPQAESEAEIIQLETTKLHAHKLGTKIARPTGNPQKTASKPTRVLGRKEEHTLRISSTSAALTEFQRQFAVFVASPHDSL